MFSNHTREGHVTAVEVTRKRNVVEFGEWQLQRKLLEHTLKTLHREQSVRLFK